MMRSQFVLRNAADKQPSARLRDLSEGYRAATNALIIAADCGCSGDLYDALWDLCQREADAFAAKQVEGR